MTLLRTRLNSISFFMALTSLGGTLFHIQIANAASSHPVPRVGTDTEFEYSDSESIPPSGTEPASSSGGTNRSYLALPSTGIAGSIPNLSARLDSIYYGGSVEKINSPYLPNDTTMDGGRATRVYIKNLPNVAYGITANAIVGAVGRFDYLPTLQQDYKWKDPYVHLVTPKLASNGNFVVASDMRLYGPLAAAARKTGEIVAFQTRFAPSYQFHHSRFTIGAVLYQQHTFRDARSDNINAFKMNANTSELYAAPNVSYQLTPTLALTCLYEMDAVRLTGSSFFNYISDSHTNNGYTDLEPGVHWSVTPDIDLNPFLNLYPGSNFSWNTTSVNLWLALKVL